MSVLARLLKGWTGRAPQHGAGPDADRAPASAEGTAPSVDASADLPGQLAQARARIDADLGCADAWLALASIYLRWGRQREAIVAFRHARDRDRGSAAIGLGLGVAAWEVGKRDESEQVLREAGGDHPDSIPIAMALANVLVAVGKIVEARGLAERVRALEPANTAALAMLARCDRREGRDADAESRLREAIAIDDSDPQAWDLLSSVLSSRGELDAAFQALARAQTLAEGRGIDLETSFKRAELYRQRGDFARATETLSHALRQRPDAAGHFMLAEALLVQGRYASGWRRYEFRRFESALLDGRPRYGKPAWTGQDLEGRTILVEAEQGIGDVVWFARYLPLLKQEGARVVFLPRIDMMGVSRRFDGVDHVLSEGEHLPPFDYQVKLMSLATQFRTTLGTIPGGVPYLRPDPASAARWQARLPAGGRPRVGIVWAGKPAQPRDRFRSMQLRQLLPILRVPDIRFHSLQKGAAEAQLADLPQGVDIEPLGVDFDDLDDLVAATSCMDLVISVCTGPAHIAGAMGKPTWTMISDPPDLRWLETRTDSPWYPTMRLFRQTGAGRWDGVVERVAGELARGPAAWQDLAHARGSSTAQRVVGPDPAPDDVDAGLARVAESRIGVVMCDPAASDCDRSIAYYGEWLQAEIDLAAMLTPAGGVLLEIGAGTGVHAASLGHALGPDGQLLLYENRLPVRRMLRQNLAANGVANATFMSRTLGERAPERFGDAEETVDHLVLDRVDGIKANLPVDASWVVAGALQTLWRCRPWLMFAQDEQAGLAALAGRVREFGYRTFRMETTLFSPSNFNRRDDDIFGGRTAFTLLGFPEERGVPVLPDGCVELRD